MSDRRSLRAYEWVTGVLGLVILIQAVATQGLENDWLLVGFWALSHLLFLDKTVFLTPDAAFMPGYPIIIAALCTTGLSGTAWLILASLVWHGIRNRDRISRLMFNTGSVAVAIAAANYAVSTVFPGVTKPLDSLSIDGLVYGLVLILTYHLVLTGAYSLLLYIEDPELPFITRLVRSLKKSLRWFMPSYYLFSMLLIHLAQTGGIIASLFFLSAIYALWRQFYLSQAYKEESIRAATDSLTGVANREGFRRYLDTTLCAARLPAAVLFVDIDDFKSINDEFGHEFGDRILCAVASLLKKFVRGDDLVVRWGGEEFIVFLWNTSIEQAFTVAERICKAVRNCELPHGAQITVSIGCSGTDDVNEVSRLVAAADNALYQAKHAGKDRVYVAATSE
ncbi:MAG: GGDEF domain-containing protein [Firmicutes bacterium]|nr:GGDEF domain-containing protein [Bacillota bacterium]